ncbi:MAG: Zn(2+)-responsive transcriptional regulator [Pseudomonadales bacterium]
MYRIGELAKLTGVSNDTLRYYEKNQLIDPAARTEAGYRMYQSEAIEKIRFIQRAKGVGFTLNDINELLSIQIEKNEHSCQEVKTFTEAKLEDVEAKLKELTRIKQALETLNEACCGGPESAEHCSILQALETGDLTNTRT